MDATKHVFYTCRNAVSAPIGPGSFDERGTFFIFALVKKMVTYALLLLVLVSCSEEGRMLRQAGSLVNQNPEEAMALLDSLDRGVLSPRLQAQYDYHYAIAFYNAYYFLDDAHAVALARAYRYKEQERNRWSNISLLIAAILATLVLYLWARKVQAEKQLLLEKEETDRIMSIAEDLQARLGSLKNSKESPIGIDVLERLCEQYYVYEGTDNLQPKIAKEVRSIVEGLRSDTEAQHRLEKELDGTRNNVMSRLRQAFPKWKEEDYLLYLFTASGFSSTTIATLLGKEKQYVYNRVYRLKERIKASGAPDSDFFLAQL